MQVCTIWSFPLNCSALTLCIFYIMQVSESAKKDLKEGMKLYNSENNVGLKNAWNIIQAEVTYFLNENPKPNRQTKPQTKKPKPKKQPTRQKNQKQSQKKNPTQKPKPNTNKKKQRNKQNPTICPERLLQSIDFGICAKAKRWLNQTLISDFVLLSI